MVQFRHFLILVISFLAAACTKANPEFALLDGNLPQPKFNGSTTKTIHTTSDSDTFNIAGECDPKIKSLTMKPVGLSAVFAPADIFTVTPATVNCASNGAFTFELKSISGLGYISAGPDYEIQVRGVTVLGEGPSSFIRIHFSNPVAAPRLLMSGGGVHGFGQDANRMSSANFTLEVRLGTIHDPNANAQLSSANFAARIGAASH